MSENNDSFTVSTPESNVEVVSSFFLNFSKNSEILNNIKTEDESQENCYNECGLYGVKVFGDIADMFLDLIDLLNNKLSLLTMPAGIDCIYNSTIYARYTFEMYVRKYCNTPKKNMFFGMNPGPWGMSQTGVPFGEVNLVRDWLKIEGPVGKPPKELPARPVLGFKCPRSEISGKRFWSLLKDICGEPENFFRTSFIYNYLPQQWMKCNGCNMTPSDFKVSEMLPLYKTCDPIFCKVLELYQVETIVAIGKFCETRAEKAIKAYAPYLNIKVLYLPHPSPRTVNNSDWIEKAMDYFEKHHLMDYYQDRKYNIT